MPTYEYLCSKCGLFDYFQSIRDAPLKSCPKCKGRKIKRQISSGAGIIFKGSGFYETDYRSSSYEKSAKADNSAQSAAASPPAPAASDTGGSKEAAKPAAGKKSTPAA